MSDKIVHGVTATISECLRCHCRDCRRFEAAKAAMESMLSNPGIVIDSWEDDILSYKDAVAGAAVEHADALLEALEGKG